MGRHIRLFVVAGLPQSFHYSERLPLTAAVLSGSVGSRVHAIRLAQQAAADATPNEFASALARVHSAYASACINTICTASLCRRRRRSVIPANHITHILVI
jgi:hypothetical protein